MVVQAGSTNPPAAAAAKLRNCLREELVKASLEVTASLAIGVIGIHCLQGRQWPAGEQRSVDHIMSGGNLPTDATIDYAR